MTQQIKNVEHMKMTTNRKHAKQTKIKQNETYKNKMRNNTQQDKGKQKKENEELPSNLSENQNTYAFDVQPPSSSTEPTNDGNQNKFEF